MLATGPNPRPITEGILTSEPANRNGGDLRRALLNATQTRAAIAEQGPLPASQGCLDRSQAWRLQTLVSREVGRQQVAAWSQLRLCGWGGGCLGMCVCVKFQHHHLGRHICTNRLHYNSYHPHQHRPPSFHAHAQLSLRGVSALSAGWPVAKLQPMPFAWALVARLKEASGIAVRDVRLQGNIVACIMDPSKEWVRLPPVYPCPFATMYSCLHPVPPAWISHKFPCTWAVGTVSSTSLAPTA